MFTRVSQDWLARNDTVDRNEALFLKLSSQHGTSAITLEVNTI